jgi:hypothetical protein
MSALNMLCIFQDTPPPPPHNPHIYFTSNLIRLWTLNHVNFKGRKNTNLAPPLPPPLLTPQPLKTSLYLPPQRNLEKLAWRMRMFRGCGEERMSSIVSHSLQETTAKVLGENVERSTKKIGMLSATMKAGVRSLKLPKENMEVRAGENSAGARAVQNFVLRAKSPVSTSTLP